jgi:hypothetical protein
MESGGNEKVEVSIKRESNNLPPKNGCWRARPHEREVRISCGVALQSGAPGSREEGQLS